MILSMDVRLGIDGIYHIVEYNEWGGCRVKALMFNCLVCLKLVLTPQIHHKNHVIKHIWYKSYFLLVLLYTERECSYAFDKWFQRLVKKYFL